MGDIPEKKFKYNFSDDPNGTHMLIAGQVAQGSKVLDIGCASGYIGEFLIKNKGCEVWGIEPDIESSDLSKNKGYAKVINKSVESGLVDEVLRNEKFDFIIVADVLEHLVNPEEILKKIGDFLKTNGKLLVSLPNVGHYSVRFSHLFGNWDMLDAGIMDKTHLHFYTLKTMQEMFRKNNWKIISVRPRGDLERWGKKINLEKVGKMMLFGWPTFFAVQFVFVLSKE